MKYDTVVIGNIRGDEMLPFYYAEQIKTRVTDFMAIFAGLQVQTGKREDAERKLINVPIRYGDIDRVVAYIKAEATQNKLLRIPLMSAVYNDIQLDDSLRKGVTSERRYTHMERGGVFPDDLQVIHQMMPVPYRLFMELAIYTSNTDQQLQILEQLLVLFDPTLSLQSGDGTFDWTKLTSVRLESIGLENNYPIGSDRNVRIVKLQFSFPIYLSIPANLRNDFIKDIMVRIGMVNNADLTNEEMIAELDSQGLDYENWFSLDDIDIDYEQI